MSLNIRQIRYTKLIETTLEVTIIYSEKKWMTKSNRKPPIPTQDDYQTMNRLDQKKRCHFLFDAGK
uniref:Uncharacterized protein n=1 Tax=Arion vulgaris TaxID=1028688 RepID=A0A0B7BAU3_9EUPU